MAAQSGSPASLSSYTLVSISEETAIGVARARTMDVETRVVRGRRIRMFVNTVWGPAHHVAVATVPTARGKRMADCSMDRRS